MPMPWPSMHHPTTMVSGDTSSTESLLWAQARLRECQEYHPDCSGTHESHGSPLPTRVLDVGVASADISLDNPKDQLPKVRLLVTSGEAAPYVCLSHRWLPVSEMTRTTQSTLQEYLQNIPWSDLTQRFQDAIVFTRRLGIRYIWIDSICIVQDDEEDWQKESVEMWSIFARSTLTLFASGAEGQNTYPVLRSDADGLFWKPTPVAQSLTLRPRNAGVDKWEVRLRPQLRPLHNLLVPLVPSSLVENPVPHSPLLRRGWVYQERLLSPRILHFGPDELIWECATMLRCECGFEPNISRVPHPKKNHAFAQRVARADMSKAESMSGLKASIDTRFARVDMSKAESMSGLRASIDTRFARDLLITRWHKIVEEYSGLDFTFSSDRLIALTGLAKQFEYLGKYYAGLWEHSLVEDMLWQRHASETQRQQLPLWRAPTWSWASIDGQVTYYEFEHTKMLCQIIRCIVTPHRLGDEFGQLESASLVVSGGLVQVWSAGPQGNHVKTETSSLATLSMDVEWVVDGLDKRTRPLFLFRVADVRFVGLFALLLWRPREESESFERIGCSTDVLGFFGGVEDSTLTII
ncbi:HET-domain-containing protein [Lophium mytilinum]|uniref:HET-domain-containing protein n=1 Tax=Lophium mytilinum TaxID=390894 RepID=A0A6A6QWR6_9PEZI|nr:HET-domain-containing protein [Lophium mytilinum]